MGERRRGAQERDHGFAPASSLSRRSLASQAHPGPVRITYSQTTYTKRGCTPKVVKGARLGIDVQYTTLLMESCKCDQQRKSVGMFNEGSTSVTRTEMDCIVDCWRDAGKQEGQVVIVWARPSRY